MREYGKCVNVDGAP